MEDTADQDILVQVLMEDMVVASLVLMVDTVDMADMVDKDQLEYMEDMVLDYLDKVLTVIIS